jgi:hypothetical protein
MQPPLSTSEGSITSAIATNNERPNLNVQPGRPHPWEELSPRLFQTTNQKCLSLTTCFLLFISRTHVVCCVHVFICLCSCF